LNTARRVENENALHRQNGTVYERKILPVLTKDVNKQSVVRSAY